MDDFLGNKLEVGDDIVIIQHTRTSSHLKRTKVVRFTPQMVVFEVDDRWQSNKVMPYKVVKQFRKESNDGR